MTPRLALLLLVGLAACSTAAPKIVGAPPPGIAYRVDGGATAETDRRADQYCQQFGKHATRQSVSHDGGASIAEYACS